MNTEKKIINSGFIIPQIDSRDYLLGALPTENLQPDRNWVPYLLENEEQNKYGVESYNCTGHTLARNFTTLVRRKFGVLLNISERFLGIMANTWPPGNAPNIVAQALHEHSSVDEKLLPFSPDINTIQKYYSPKPMEQGLLNEAHKLLSKYIFKYQWVGTGGNIDRDAIWNELANSTLGASVYAWTEKDGIYYKPQGVQDTHFTTLVGGKYGEYWLVQDSAIPFIKKLEWNYNFGYIQRYYVAEQLTPQQSNYFLDWLKKLWETFFAIKKQAEELKKEPSIVELIKETKEKELKKDKTLEFAQAIEEYEGYFPPNADYPNGSRSWRNKNSGNLKYTPYTRTLLAIDYDPQGFAIFSSYEKGFDALCILIRDAAHNQLLKYKNCTIKTFFEEYAPKTDKNNPLFYAIQVAKQIDEKVENYLSEFIL